MAIKPDPALNSLAIGFDAEAAHQDAIVIGDTMVSTKDGDVVIGKWLFGIELTSKSRLLLAAIAALPELDADVKTVADDLDNFANYKGTR